MASRCRCTASTHSRARSVDAASLRYIRASRSPPAARPQCPSIDARAPRSSSPRARTSSISGVVVVLGERGLRRDEVRLEGATVLALERRRALVAVRVEGAHRAHHTFGRFVDVAHRLGS